MKKFDAIIVGAGAAGSIAALELAKRGFKVIVLEKGPKVDEAKAHQRYRVLQGGVEVWLVEALGGTTLVSLGNAVPVLLEELKSLGIDVSHEIGELIHELKAAPLPSSFRGRGTKLFIDACRQLKLEVNHALKLINPKLCKNCRRCAAGCPNNAKWTALKALNEAISYGAQILTSVADLKVRVQGNEARGVQFKHSGLLKEVYADTVILAAGPIGSPLILRSLGIEEAGRKLFVDIFVDVGAPLPNVSLVDEVPMQVYVKLPKIMLSPHYTVFLQPYLSSKGVKIPSEDIMSIMVKIADSSRGEVLSENVIYKPLTKTDLRLLERGVKEALQILEATGAEVGKAAVTFPRGAHPGGTAPIGEIVNRDLETEISQLHVVDASVLPKAPGAPPMLTIMALAKYLAKQLAQRS